LYDVFKRVVLITYIRKWSWKVISGHLADLTTSGRCKSISPLDKTMAQVGISKERAC